MRKIKPLRYQLLILCMGMLMSCEYINNLTQEGELVASQKEAGTIKYIVANAPCRLLLHNAETTFIDISGYDNLMEGLTVTYRNDSLIIDHSNKNYLQKSKLIEIKLSAQSLKSLTANMVIEVKGTDTIMLDELAMIINGGAKFSEIDLDVRASNISLHVYGNNIGNFHLEGESTSSHYTIEGSVNINALDLACDQASIIHKSIGYCKVNTRSNLDVTTYSSGNTYYLGRAEVKHQRKEVSYMQSTGEVIQIK